MELAKVDGLAGYITVEKAAQLLGMTSDGVIKIVRRHNVPFVRLGRSLVLRPSDLAIEEESVKRMQEG